MDLKFVGILLLLAAAVYTAHVQKDKEEDPEEAAFEDFDEEDEVDQENISKRKDAVNRVDMGQFVSGRNRFCTCKVPHVLGDEPEESRDQSRERINSFADEAQYDRAKENPEVLIKLVKPYFKTMSLKCHCTANKPVVRLLEFVHLAKVAENKAKVEFLSKLRSLIKVVKKQ
ncbi:uncharacterized protein LOC135692858 isoform X1 [Rhopilema esculentum]|uniref:uncharacterized protein LOC135692858 isoform X1 n=1 Tax=Rhopilema esculentum TaxID=499914 RepID=UPI0031DE9741